MKKKHTKINPLGACKIRMRDHLEAEVTSRTNERDFRKTIDIQAEINLNLNVVETSSIEIKAGSNVIETDSIETEVNLNIIETGSIKVKASLQIAKIGSIEAEVSLKITERDVPEMRDNQKIIGIIERINL